MSAKAKPKAHPGAADSHAARPVRGIVRRASAPGGQSRSKSPIALRARQASQNASARRVRSEDAPDRASSKKHTRESWKAPPAQKIVACFKKYDVNGDGVISLEELTAVMKHLDKSETLHESDVQCVLKEIDTMGDGQIDYTEFVAWINKSEDDCSPSHRFFQHAEHIINAETPKERLLRCIEELREGEKAALPPKLTEAVFEGSDDLWMFKSAGDVSPEAEKYDEWNRVIRISPTSLPYKAGVRIGWHVLEVGDFCVADTMKVPNLIKARQGGGGGAQRGVTVKFISPASFEAHRVAMAALPALREAVEAAQAACSNLDPGSGIETEVVTIKYYNHKVSFPAADGRILTEDIDGALGLSALMPGYQLHLAEWREGDEHLVCAGKVESGASPLVERCHTVTFDATELGMFFDAATGRVSQVAEVGQAVLQGVKSGWVIESVDGQRYKEGLLESLDKEKSFAVIFRDAEGFSGLALGQTYFLIVEMAASVSPGEVKWHARMKAEREAERLAALPPHDCKKMQVPLNLQVSTHHGEFLVEIDNSEGKTLGMNILPSTDASSWIIEEVLWFGIIHRWNVSCPSKQLKPGDTISEVNGVREDGASLAEELRKKQVLFIMIRRVDYFPGDRIRAKFLGHWYDACLERDNRDGTVTVMWTDGDTIEGRAKDTIKGPTEIYRSDEKTESRHTRVNGDYRFFGVKSSRPQYINSAGTLVHFKGQWQIGQSDDSFRCFYSLPGETGLLAPMGVWPSPINPGCIADLKRGSATGCLLCTESMKPD